MIRFLLFLPICLILFVCSGCSPRWYVVVSGDASAVVDPVTGRRSVAISLKLLSAGVVDSLSVYPSDSLSFHRLP